MRNLLPLALLLVSASAVLGEGDPDSGGALYASQCATCHMVGADARNRVGPILNGIFDRQAASVADYTYSPAMERAGADGLTWTHETLDAYIAAPKALVTGTKMSFRGLEDQQARADLIAFLRQYSASPADIPESAPTAEATNPDLDPAILELVGDPAYGQYLSSECMTCHQADGDDAGIPSMIGWPTEDFVLAMHAYKQKLRPHLVMQMMASRLSDEEIAGLAAYFTTLN